MEKSWKNDDRLKKLPPEKLTLLSSFADRLAQMPRHQLMPALMQLNKEAAAKGLTFTNEETDLITDILTQNFSPAEKKRLESLRALTKGFGSR